MSDALRELLDHRDLLYMVTWREIRVKYKQSIMGFLWAILMPAIVVSAGVIVRYALAMTSGKPISMVDLTAVTVKAAPWAFFVASIRFGTNSMLSNVNLVTKIYLPRLVFPLAAVLSQLFDFSVAIVLIAVLLTIAGVGLSIQLLWLPVIVFVLIVLAMSLGIILSAASLFLRDVKFIVDVLLTFAIFFTPVFYESSLFGKWAPVIMANPISPLLEGISRVVVLHQQPHLLWLLYSTAVTAILLVFSLKMFRKLEPLFAESI